jgi:hypothetical protein
MRIPIAVLLGCFLLGSATASAGQGHEYPSPDGKFKGIVISTKKSGTGSEESQIEMRGSDGTLLFQNSYESDDGEHGFGVVRAGWSPDSKFFVYSMTSSGGHQAWHFPTNFIAVTDLKIHELDNLLGLITSPDFKFAPPDTIQVMGRTRANIEAERSFSAALKELD